MRHVSMDIMRDAMCFPCDLSLEDMVEHQV